MKIDLLLSAVSGFVVAAIFGWILNIITLAHMAFIPENFIMIGLRAIGIFLAPLGAVLGFI